MPGTTNPQLRPGTPDDLPQLTALYNHYVTQTPVTFDTVAFSPEQRQTWLSHYADHGPHRLFVAEETGGEDGGEGGGRLLGYATSSPFRPKPAYATSVETTVYVAPGAGGRGVGTLLYEGLFAALAGEDVHRAYAGVTLPNEASVRLHERFGFRRCGVFGQTGRKFGRYWDVAFYEKPLG
ncbi:N-acetyltransferase family protein [Streptantibioticus parmotrematis]|uniref:GNAT family N-acetyltransferase n=1 Tax=Streptantibioticus parmotrematis TaxID=2873249 RepID=UPI0033EC431A